MESGRWLTIKRTKPRKTSLKISEIIGELQRRIRKISLDVGKDTDCRVGKVRECCSLLWLPKQNPTN